MVASMLVRLLIFIIYIAHVSFGLQYSGSISHSNIIELITTNIREKNCNFSMDSSAFSACERPLVNVSAVNSVFFRDEVYLCMGVYDVALHICDLEKNNQSLSSSIDEVIKEMNGETQHEIYSVENICNRMKTIKFEAASQELNPWISKLNNTLQIQKSCEDACIKGHEVNPLCIFVLWGNTLRTEPKVEKVNVADMNVNTSKLSKKADEKPLISQPSDKSLRQSKIQPSLVVENTDTSLNEPDVNHNKPEEVTSKRQEDATMLDEQNYEFTLQEDQDIKSSDEPKISTSVETDIKQSQTTSSSNEAVNHLETDTDVTNFGDQGDTSSVALPEPPTTAWKITSLAKNDVELTDSALPSAYRKHFDNAEDSHFFAYFMAVIVICIIGYLIYHNKHKLLALVLEGRRRREMRRRTAHGGYRKLDSSLEEAVTSTCSTSVTHVIY